MKAKDLTDQQFGRLNAIRRKAVIGKDGRSRTAWECVCDCGNLTTVLQDNLVSGKIQSCGCLLNEISHNKNTTHHESSTKLYGVWLSMRRRCDTASVPAYQHYGGRGIRVCDAWDNSYESFRDWALSTGYSDTLTLDRIDVNGNYEPSNCRWVDRKCQANNRRTCRYITWRGETHTLMEWCEQLGLSYKKMHQRLTAGWDPERMLTTK